LAKPRVVSVDRIEGKPLRAVIQWNTIKVIFVRDKDGNPVVSGRINTEGAKGSEGTYIPLRRYAKMMKTAYAIFKEGPKSKEN